MASSEVSVRGSNGSSGKFLLRLQRDIGEARTRSDSHRWAVARHEAPQGPSSCKDLSIANGEGLPADAVEKEAALAEQIIKLYSLKPKLIIEMLMSATQQMSIQPSRKKYGKRSAKDVDTLLRVLCHSKNEHASEFLKLQYELPKYSDYEDNTAAKESYFLRDILKRSSSFNRSEKGHTSFRVVMKKLQEAKF